MCPRLVVVVVLCCGQERDSRLVEVTLVHGHGLWWIFWSCGGCEAGPCGKVSVDGGTPCGEGRRENDRVVEGNVICHVIVS
jgi:hypothetical protein